MKKVVSIDMVAHLWANQSQSEARNSQGNFYFDGNTIYSYDRHFAIAKHVVNESGLNAVLYSDRGYSVTTSKQQSIVSRAMQGLNIIVVPDADNRQDQNFAQWKTRITDTAKNLLTARKPEKYLNPINYEYSNACKYAAFWGVEVPTDLREIYESILTPEYKIKLKQADDKAKEDRKIWEENEKIEAAEHLEKWRNGEVERHTCTGLSYLKLSADGDSIQTSQNVFIPLNIAKEFYKTILETVKNGGCKNCNMRFMHTYNVKEITAKQIIVGCHTIEITEIERLTNSLNW